MTTKSARFSYNPDDQPLSDGALPFLPITLSHRTNQVQVNALLDSGASVNVLPYQMGLRLGLKWDTTGESIVLGGNLGDLPARRVILQAQIVHFEPVRLVFAWTQSEDAPLILGQLNFFKEFDVTFLGAEHIFSITPHQHAK